MIFVYAKKQLKNKFSENKSFTFYINILTTRGNPLNERIWEIYGKASRVVHGKVTRGEDKAKDLRGFPKCQ